MQTNLSAQEFAGKLLGIYTGGVLTTSAPSFVSSIGESVAASMPEHVRVGLEPQL
jgi:hypothetical protein